MVVRVEGKLLVFWWGRVRVGRLKFDGRSILIIFSIVGYLSGKMSEGGSLVIVVV